MRLLSHDAFRTTHFRLRGGRQGARSPLATPARDFVPSIPDLMHSHTERLAHMPTKQRGAGCQQSDSWHNGGICGCADRVPSITCRGFGGMLRSLVLLIDTTYAVGVRGTAPGTLWVWVPGRPRISSFGRCPPHSWPTVAKKKASWRDCIPRVPSG